MRKTDFRVSGNSLTFHYVMPYIVPMKTVLQVKMLPEPEQHAALVETMRVFNEACSWIAERARDEGVTGKFRIHRLTYYEVRKRFGLPAQMAVRAIAKVADALNRRKGKRITFRPDGAVVYDQRIMRFIGMEAVNLTTLNGRITIPIQMGAYQRHRFSRAKGQADLMLRGGTFYLLVSIETPEEPPIDPERLVGVDLGIVTIAATSDGDTHFGKAVERVRARAHRARQTFQATGTKSAKRRLRKLAGRQSRFQRLVNHNISSRLVRMAKGTKAVLVLEDLKHIRRRITVRKGQRERHSNWSFGQLRVFIEYKARLAGVQVLFVDPRNTSKACSKCGHVSKANRRSQALFSCRRCGFEANADLNAARNLATRGAVNRPDLIVSAHGQLAFCWQR